MVYPITYVIKYYFKINMVSTLYQMNKYFLPELSTAALPVSLLQSQTVNKRERAKALYCYVVWRCRYTVCVSVRTLSINCAALIIYARTRIFYNIKVHGRRVSICFRWRSHFFLRL